MAKVQTKRTITPADIAAARNLKREWTLWQRRRKESGEPHSEQWAGGELGWTQGAVNQYLNGNLVLHFEAVLKFAALLHVLPEHIRTDFDYTPRLSSGGDSVFPYWPSQTDRRGQRNTRGAGIETQVDLGHTPTSAKTKAPEAAVTR